MSQHYNSSSGGLYNSSHIPTVPSDDDLYDAGWAKHWDPNRKAYYYYPIDGSQATTWENPLTATTHHASGSGASVRHHTPTVASIREESHDNDSSSSFDDNEASFFGDSMHSLTLSALMAGSSRFNKSGRPISSSVAGGSNQNNNNNSIGASTINTAKQQQQQQYMDNNSFQASVRLDASQTIPEVVESGEDEEDYDDENEEEGAGSEVFHDEYQTEDEDYQTEDEYQTEDDQEVVTEDDELFIETVSNDDDNKEMESQHRSRRSQQQSSASVQKKKKDYTRQERQILQHVRSLSTPYCDKEFPPTVHSLINRKEVPEFVADVKKFSTQTEWKRAPDLWQEVGDTRHPLQLYTIPNVKPTAVKQGGLENCYFLASLTSLALIPTRVQRLFLSADDGIYALRMYVNGMPTQVVVDNHVPATKDDPSHNNPLAGIPKKAKVTIISQRDNGNGTQTTVREIAYPNGRMQRKTTTATIESFSGKLKFSKTTTDELWVSIVEKAYAKVNHNYAALEAGHHFETLRDLTGAPGYYYLSVEESHYTLMERYSQQHYCMSCGIEHDPTTGKLPANLDKMGLLPLHAYSILAVCRVSTTRGRKQRLVKLRNPWGDAQEWKGQWSNVSKLWTDAVKQQIPHLLEANMTAHDGIFWMPWEEFKQYYNSWDVNKVVDSHHYSGAQVVQQDPKVGYHLVSVTISQAGHYNFGVSQTSNRQMKPSLKYQYSSVRTILVKATSSGLDGCQFIKGAVGERRDVYIDLEDTTLQPGQYYLFVDIWWDASAKHLPQKQVSVNCYGSTRVVFGQDVAAQYDKIAVLTEMFASKVTQQPIGVDLAGKQRGLPHLPANQIHEYYNRNDCSEGYHFRLYTNQSKDVILVEDQKFMRLQGAELVKPARATQDYKVFGKEKYLVRIKPGQVKGVFLKVKSSFGLAGPTGKSMLITGAKKQIVLSDKLQTPLKKNAAKNLPAKIGVDLMADASVVGTSKDLTTVYSGSSFWTDSSSTAEDASGTLGYDSFISEVTPLPPKQQRNNNNKYYADQNTPVESFEDEPEDDYDDGSPRVWGGTDRKVLRIPRVKKKPGTPSSATALVEIEREIEESKALVEQRRQEYQALFKEDHSRYQHRRCGPLPACLILLVMLIGMGVGGYFLISSLIQNAQDLQDPNAPILSPTAQPLALPDYTEEALQNPVSEQATALNWLRADPNYASYSRDEKAARFALMTIYSATGGEAWQRSDDFELPESSYAMASHCDFPYYTCPGYTPSVTFAPIATATPATLRPTPASTPGATSGGASPAPGGASPAPGGATVSPAPGSTASPGVSPAGNATTAPDAAVAAPEIVPETAAPGTGARSNTVAESENRNSDHHSQRHLQQHDPRRLYFDGSFANGAILNLTDQGLLQGTLPPEMALLTELQAVQISNNLGLIGTIPDSIRFWEDFLFDLIITGNSIDGKIPTILGQLRHVRTLWLNDNRLEATIPEQLSLLSQMTSLHLQNNQLTGTVPASLATYPFVHDIDWSNNKLSGPLPTFYVPGAQASQVRRVVLNSNSFNGTIPTEFGGLSNLEILHLHSNPNLVGNVPGEICMLPKLQVVSVDCNQVACSCTQCECPTGGSPRTADLTSILPPYTSDAIATGGQQTPQAIAYNWLITDPSVQSYPTDQQQQRYALATLFYSTNQAPDYDSWFNQEGWVDLDGGEECTWASTSSLFFRIPDSATDGLSNCREAKLSGDNSGGTFQSYQSLRLGNNSLAGTLPPEIALLSNLQMLQLHGNKLTGPIPIYLNELTALNVLDLEDTSLTGSLPTQLTDLQVLNKLYLGANALNGTLPTRLGRMTALDTLQLNDNQFSGTIPTELALMNSTLQRIFLSSNSLVGRLPTPGFAQMTSLVDLYLDDNRLTGNLQALPFGAAPNLAHVVLSGNSFTGTIPPQLGDMPRIQVLLLDQNQLRGTLPPEMSRAAASLQWLHTSSNLLTGTLPTQIGQLTQLIEFHSSSNRIDGKIPTQLASCQQLRSLMLDTNRLSGTVPPLLGSFPFLTMLKVDHNDFRGILPTELTRLSSTLTWLDVSWNALTGPIPTELALLAHLEWLYLERNNMDGEIPTQLGLLTKLNEMSLYGMRLSGTIPVELSMLTSIGALFLHENFLDGTIPSELGLLTNLSSLWLHKMSLTGTVPAELCNLLQNGKLETLAIDCDKVTCTCGCSCPSEGGDAPRTDPSLAAPALAATSGHPPRSRKGSGDGVNIFHH